MLTNTKKMYRKHIIQSNIFNRLPLNVSLPRCSVQSMALASLCSWNRKPMLSQVQPSLLRKGATSCSLNNTAHALGLEIMKIIGFNTIVENNCHWDVSCGRWTGNNKAINTCSGLKEICYICKTLMQGYHLQFCFLKHTFRWFLLNMNTMITLKFLCTWKRKVHVHVPLFKPFFLLLTSVGR